MNRRNSCMSEGPHVILREPKRPKDLRIARTRFLAALRMTRLEHNWCATIVVAAALLTSSSFALAGDESARSMQSEVSDGLVIVTTRVNTASARVAEPVQLVLEVEAPRGSRVELPAKTDRLGEFEVRRSERTVDIPSATQADKRNWNLRLTLESIKTGELAIPPLDVHYTVDATSSTFKTLSTKPIPVRITSVLENRPDPTKFRDIKQTVDVPVPAADSRSWIAWSCGGAVATVVALLLAVAVVKRRRRGPLPAAWALNSIEELERVDVLQTAGPEALFNEVVDVVREFFELEFNVPALPRTTREFLAEASGEVGLPEVASKRLSWLASVADEIKFARLRVGEEHLKHAFAQAKEFIAECEAHRRATTKGAA